jgi:hypothetical protein
MAANRKICGRPCMPAHGRGCVKTHFIITAQKIGLSERAAFNYFRVGKGQMTPETEIALRFYTPSANSSRTETLLKVRKRFSKRSVDALSIEEDTESPYRCQRQQRCQEAGYERDPIGSAARLLAVL